MSPRYDVELARPARRALSDELPVKVAAAAWELIDGALRADPRRVGKPLRAPYVGHWIARRSSYCVRYRIDDNRHVITVLDVTSTRRRLPLLTSGPPRLGRVTGGCSGNEAGLGLSESVIGVAPRGRRAVRRERPERPSEQ